MDLSNDFETINHELLIAKLHADGFSIEALAVLISYLQERWQRVKINPTFSSWTLLLQGVPQGSVLVPCCLIFTSLNEIDICDSNLKLVLEKLEHNPELAISWFEMNYMKP